MPCGRSWVDPEGDVSRASWVLRTLKSEGLLKTQPNQPWLLLIPTSWWPKLINSLFCSSSLSNFPPIYYCAIKIFFCLFFFLFNSMPLSHTQIALSILLQLGLILLLCGFSMLIVAECIIYNKIKLIKHTILF